MYPAFHRQNDVCPHKKGVLKNYSLYETIFLLFRGQYEPGSYEYDRLTEEYHRRFRRDFHYRNGEG